MQRILQRQARALCTGGHHDLSQLERSFDAIKRRLLRPREVETRRIPSMSVETVNAATMLKKAKRDPARFESVLRGPIARLLRQELMSVFWVFVRAKEMELAEVMFGLIRKEIWYKPQASLYLHLISAYSERFDADPKAMERIFELLDESEGEGLIPNVFAFIVPMQACLRRNDFETCMKLYERMHASTCRKDVQFYVHLSRRFEEAGLVEEAHSIYERFLELRNTQGLDRLLRVD